MLVDFLTANYLKLTSVIDSVSVVFVCFCRFHTFNELDFVDELSNLLDNDSSSNLTILGDINLNTLELSATVFKLSSILASHGFFARKRRRVYRKCLDYLCSRFRKRSITSLKKFVIDFGTVHSMTSLLTGHLDKSRERNPGFLQCKNSYLFGE